MNTRHPASFRAGARWKCAGARGGGWVFVMLVFPSSLALAAGFFFESIHHYTADRALGRRSVPWRAMRLSVNHRRCCKVPRLRYTPALTTGYNTLAGNKHDPGTHKNSPAKQQSAARSKIFSTGVAT